jgi:hypothetical protein
LLLQSIASLGLASEENGTATQQQRVEQGIGDLELIVGFMKIENKKEPSIRTNLR